MNFIPCISSLSLQTQQPGILKYSRFGLTLVKLHISRCKILNGDSGLHSECNARCVMFLTDMPLCVSQSLPLCEYRGLFIGQHSLQFTFHNPSQLYTKLIYDYLLLYKVIKSQLFCGLGDQSDIE